MEQWDEEMRNDEEQSSDLRMARELLISDDCSVVVVAGGKVAARAEGRGLGPLLQVLDELPGEIYPARVADRVVGMAAALFLSEAADAVYAGTISIPARRHLMRRQVAVVAQSEVSFIQNRTRTGLCPLEEIALEEACTDRARRKIRDFCSRR